MGIVASLLAAPYVGSIPSQVSTWAASFREKRVSLVAPEHESNVASSPSELVMGRLVRRNTKRSLLPLLLCSCPADSPQRKAEFWESESWESWEPCLPGFNL